MANEKIHEYVDQVQTWELATTEVMIDSEVYDAPIDVWRSKKLRVRDLMSPFSTSNGAFLHLNNFVLPSVNTARPVPVGSPVVMNNMGINYDQFGQPSIMVPYMAGTYKVDVTMQVSRSSGGSSQQLSAWFRVNNNDVPYSNVHVNTVANTNFMEVTFSALLTVWPYDGIQVVVAVTDTGIYLHNELANGNVPHPATPACRVIITNA